MEHKASATSLPQAADAASGLQSKVDRHLLFCSAATVGATLVITTGAQAAIVSSPSLNVSVPVTTGTTQRVYIDFDTLSISTGTTAPAGSDMSFLDRLGSTASGYFRYNRLFAIGATTTTGPVIDPNTTSQVGNAANFPAGTTINSTSPFHQFGALAQHFYSSSGAVFNYGNFTTTGVSYLGFDFTNAAGQTRYGWIQVSFNASNYAANTSALTILRFAYDNTGAPIVTGAVPEPNEMALGCLAAGAAGLAVWRRKRAEKPAQA